MNSDPTEIDQAIQNSYAALQQGNRSGARYWAQRAAWLAPEREDPWLVLAEVSSPNASLAYLHRALKNNPTSERALNRIPWAQERLAAQVKAAAASAGQANRPSKPAKPAQKRPLFSAGKLLVGCGLVTVLVAGWLGASWLDWPDGLRVAQAFIPRSNPTPTVVSPAVQAAPTQTVTSTQLPTPTATATRLPSATPIPTNTPQPTLTAIVDPTVGGANLAQDAFEDAAIPQASPGEKQVLVDISEQHLYAYEGDQLVFSFVASTGKGGGTLTGTFPVLDKIENAYSDPWGFWMPDWLGIYYVGPDLENGIHSLPVLQNGSEIWGDDIGKPITYGCVVLSPQDAKMLYNWIEIGTPVHIQN